MRTTATKSLSRLVLGALLLGLGIWSRPSSAQPGSTAEVDYCAACDATGGCIACCVCNGEGSPNTCRLQCAP